MSLLATILHGIFVIVAFCSLYIQRPYVFDYQDWVYYSCVELFLLVFVLYFAPIYLQSTKVTPSRQTKKLRKSHRKKRCKRVKGSDSQLSTRRKTQEKCIEHQIVNQRRHRRRRRRTFEFIVPIMQTGNSLESHNKKQEFSRLTSKIGQNVKRKLRQSKHAPNRKPQHVKIEINHEALVPNDDKIPPLLPSMKPVSFGSNDNDKIEIIFGRE